MPHALPFLVFTVAGWLNRHQEDLIDYLREENRVLREQLGGRPLRLTDAQRRRLAVRGKKLGRRVLTQVVGIVTPDTILRWYRQLIAQKYNGSARRRRGRPLTPQAVAELVVRMAVDNPRWGYTRIRGALANLGHETARNTVKRILLEHGIAPAPERSQRTPWKTFLQAHWEGLAAADLFTVEVLTLEGRRTAQFLLSRGCMSGRPINRTLRRRARNHVEGHAHGSAFWADWHHRRNGQATNHEVRVGLGLRRQSGQEKPPLLRHAVIHATARRAVRVIPRSLSGSNR